MQIEIIGCTSAGKSTLIRNVLQANHQQDIDLVTSYDFVLRQFRLDWIKYHTLGMLLLNLLALGACLATWPKNHAFLKFVVGFIYTLPAATVSRIDKLKAVRLTLRNMGIYEIICRSATEQQIVLADEGTLQIAHSLFIHVGIEPKMADLSTFVQLVPLPDAIVYVKQPISILVERTLVRGHHRIPEGSPGQVAAFIRQAAVTFDQLEQAPILKNRLLVIDRQRYNLVRPTYQDNSSVVKTAHIFQAGLRIAATNRSIQSSLLTARETLDSSTG